MNDAIANGIYRGPATTRSISLDRRLTRIQTPDGTYIDLPSVEYCNDLERQILELRTRMDTLESGAIHQDGVMKRLMAMIRKVESKLR